MKRFLALVLAASVVFPHDIFAALRAPLPARPVTHAARFSQEALIAPVLEFPRQSFERWLTAWTFGAEALAFAGEVPSEIGTALSSIHRAGDSGFTASGQPPVSGDERVSLAIPTPRARAIEALQEMQVKVPGVDYIPTSFLQDMVLMEGRLDPAIRPALDFQMPWYYTLLFVVLRRAGHFHLLRKGIRMAFMLLRSSFQWVFAHELGHAVLAGHLHSEEILDAFGNSDESAAAQIKRIVRQVSELSPLEKDLAKISWKKAADHSRSEKVLTRLQFGFSAVAAAYGLYGLLNGLWPQAGPALVAPAVAGGMILGMLLSLVSGGILAGLMGWNEGYTIDAGKTWSLLTLYSTTSPREEAAELFATMMVYPERVAASRNLGLRRKAYLLRQRVFGGRTLHGPLEEPLESGLVPLGALGPVTLVNLGLLLLLSVALWPYEEFWGVAARFAVEMLWVNILVLVSRPWLTLRLFQWSWLARMPSWARTGFNRVLASLGAVLYETTRLSVVLMLIMGFLFIKDPDRIDFRFPSFPKIERRMAMPEDRIEDMVVAGPAGNSAREPSVFSRFKRGVVSRTAEQAQTIRRIAEQLLPEKSIPMGQMLGLDRARLVPSIRRVPSPGPVRPIGALPRPLKESFAWVAKDTLRRPGVSPVSPKAEPMGPEFSEWAQVELTTLRDVDALIFHVANADEGLFTAVLLAPGNAPPIALQKDSLPVHKGQVEIRVPVVGNFDSDPLTSLRFRVGARSQNMRSRIDRLAIQSVDAIYRFRPGDGTPATHFRLRWPRHYSYYTATRDKNPIFNTVPDMFEVDRGLPDPSQATDIHTEMRWHLNDPNNIDHLVLHVDRAEPPRLFHAVLLYRRHHTAAELRFGLQPEDDPATAPGFIDLGTFEARTGAAIPLRLGPPEFLPALFGIELELRGGPWEGRRPGMALRMGETEIYLKHPAPADPEVIGKAKPYTVTGRSSLADVFPALSPGDAAYWIVAPFLVPLNILKELAHLAAAKLLGLRIVDWHIGWTAGYVTVYAEKPWQRQLFLFADPFTNALAALGLFFSRAIASWLSGNPDFAWSSGAAALMTATFAGLFISMTIGSAHDWKQMRRFLHARSLAAA